MILALMDVIWATALRSPKNSGLQGGLSSRYGCDALTNRAMKPLTLGPGHLWVLIFPWGMNQWTKWYMKWIIFGFKPRWSPEFFRLLYAIAKIAFITALSKNNLLSLLLLLLLFFFFWRLLAVTKCWLKLCCFLGVLYFTILREKISFHSVSLNGQKWNPKTNSFGINKCYDCMKGLPGAVGEKS